MIINSFMRVLAGMLAAATVKVSAAEPWLDATASAGVDFHYRAGLSGQYHFPEIMGGGAAVFDYDRDGLMDIYLVQGGSLLPDGDPAGGDRLLRNVSRAGPDGQFVLRFEDVTEKAGIRALGYGMGVAAGDLTGNGYPDLLVLNYGPNQLWRNNGDGSFSDITEGSGVAGQAWSVSASLANLDGDGLSEIMIANYVDFDLDNHRVCRSAMTSTQDYCSPSAYPGVADRLYRNLGEGRFDDISESSGIAGQARHGLGVVASDLDGDGRIDLYVANDGVPNALWLNRGDLRFEDDAFLAGVAVNAGGKSEAGMGVDAADFDHAQGEDLFVTHMRMESNTLYVSDDQGWFSDATSRFGLATPSLGYTGFGTAWTDLDRDGWLDLVVANGAVVAEAALVALEDPFPYHQVNQVFINEGGQRFRDASGESGSAFEFSGVTRGLAVGDLDNDGRPDLVLVNIEGPARVLLNRIDSGHHWLGLEPVDQAGRLLTQTVAWRVDSEGQLHQRRRSRSDGSYASARDSRVLFGLGRASEPVTVELRWPDGQRERFADLAVDRYHRLIRGGGQPLPESGAVRSSDSGEAP